MKAMNTTGGVLIGQKEETKPTTYLKMETQWKDYDARLLAIDGRTNPLSPAKYVSSKIVSSLAQKERKAG